MTENCQLWRLLATSSSTHMDVWHNIFLFQSGFGSVFEKYTDLVWNEFGSDIIVTYYLLNS